MKLVKKTCRAIVGLFLLVIFTKKFRAADLLKNKRIVIVGPASSAYNTNRGAFIDSFDYVIRINKAPFLVNDGKFKNDIGSKTDILVHSFFENDFSGGGPLDFQLYDRLGIQFVINPIPTWFGRRATFNFYKKYLLRRIVYTLYPKDYKAIIPAFGQFRPTTGFCALLMALNAEFSELFITGFTFFKTPYGDGYRDALKDVEKNKKYIADSKIHNPDCEYETFKVLLKKNIGKSIMVDNELKLILAQDGIVCRGYEHAENIDA